MILWVTGSQVEVWPNEETACIRSVRKLKIQSKILGRIDNLSNFRKSNTNQRISHEILQIQWYEFVRNEQITSIARLHNQFHSSYLAAFERMTRLNENVPANQVIQCHVKCTLGRIHDSSWRRPTCRPRSRTADRPHPFGHSTCRSVKVRYQAWSLR